MMPVSNDISYATTTEVRDACLCLHAQRAARALARRFDEALRPAGLTNGQFSLLMALNRPEPPPPGPVAEVLAMDRTSLTALVKPLQRRGLIEVMVAPGDRRSRRLKLTPEGYAVLAIALPIWRSQHAALEASLPVGGDIARSVLSAVTGAAAAVGDKAAPPCP